MDMKRTQKKAQKRDKKEAKKGGKKGVKNDHIFRGVSGSKMITFEKQNTRQKVRAIQFKFNNITNKKISEKLITVMTKKCQISSFLRTILRAKKGCFQDLF